LIIIILWRDKKICKLRISYLVLMRAELLSRTKRAVHGRAESLRTIIQPLNCCQKKRAK